MSSDELLPRPILPCVSHAEESFLFQDTGTKMIKKLKQQEQQLIPNDQ